MEAIFGAIVVAQLVEMRLSMRGMSKRVTALEMANPHAAARRARLHSCAAILAGAVVYTLHP